MIDDAVLAAIAGAVDRGGDVDLALAALGRIDPLLRGTARRRLRAAHADALQATAGKRGPEAGCDTLRLAYLLVARTLPPRAARGDPAAIEAAFAAARAARPPARSALWWPTALAALAALAFLGAIGAGARAAAHGHDLPAVAQDGGALQRWGRERPQTPGSFGAPTAPAERAVRGAFATGGVPAKAPGDSALTRALGTDTPAFVSALDRRSEARSTGDGNAAEAIREAEAEMREARGRALSPEVREALGPGAARALDALFSAAREASAANGAAGEKALSRAFTGAVSALDDELAGQGFGYFVDGEIVTEGEGGRPLVVVYSFRVARVSVFAAGATTVRALQLRRLDKLNWSPTLLGFTRPTLRVAAVLLDQLDEQVVTVIAVGLAEGASVPLFDADAPDAERAVVEARAGELVRAEYGALPGLDPGAAAGLGKLLGRRRTLFARWEKLAAARGLTLTVPPGYRLPEGFRRSLERLAPRDELDELTRIDDALGDGGREGAFAALRDALASSVERHEVQHRLDAAGPQPPPMPATLEARVGPLGRGGDEVPLAAGARAELSAYLSEIARDPRTPRVGLTLLARFLFDRHMHGTPESYAALSILEGLGEGLGTRARGPLVAGSTVDRRAVAALFLELTALPPDRLRDAAAALWAKLFSTPLPDLRRIAPPG